MLYQGILTFGFITNVMDLTSFKQFKSKDLIVNSPIWLLFISL